jgi:hypothetical protein
MMYGFFFFLKKKKKVCALVLSGCKLSVKTIIGVISVLGGSNVLISALLLDQLLIFSIGSVTNSKGRLE